MGASLPTKRGPTVDVSSCHHDGTAPCRCNRGRRCGSADNIAYGHHHRHAFSRDARLVVARQRGAAGRRWQCVVSILTDQTSVLNRCLWSPYIYSHLLFYPFAPTSLQRGQSLAYPSVIRCREPPTIALRRNATVPPSTRALKVLSCRSSSSSSSSSSVRYRQRVFTLQRSRIAVPHYFASGLAD